MTTIFYEYPLALDCEQQDISVNDDFHLRAISDEDRRRLLGIRDVTLNSEGRLESSRGGMFLNGADVGRQSYLLSSNYLLTCDNSDKARDFNFALKLVARSWSSLYIGYGSDGGQVFNLPPCYYGRTRLSINNETLTELKSLLCAIQQHSNDSKLNLMRDIWMHAMSDAPRPETRFVEVTTLLEMLLLPTQSSELTFRFALRIAKLAEHFRFGDATATFKQAKTLYGIRSKLVHSGRDDHLTANEEAAYEYARILMVNYLHSPNMFEDAELDKLCVRT
ncbi:HEPN domain-containing protein [Uliginosibacterium gangwonense]|uniref:HEPN domain-containing protein n=1 Tax=Uliginosibacterium gangwonense TaxID=392736 RepID=UPI0003638D8A|nr:HEPN domain-containing protein [Uliginosibacterium gangwonense]